MKDHQGVGNGREDDCLKEVSKAGEGNGLTLQELGRISEAFLCFGEGGREISLPIEEGS